MLISELHAILPGVALAATVGAAIMAGLLFAFSNFVMRALLQMAPAAGMEAMQRINLTIVNPVFLLVFVGTALLSFALVMMALGLQASAAPRWLVAGAALYLVGVVGVTVFINVPLNNALAKASPQNAADAWPKYVDDWLQWNHVRTVLAVAAVGCLAVGVMRLGQSVGGQ
jgi:uncharacterized membrane protein